jgi:plasmanylethanolamine desaturase
MALRPEVQVVIDPPTARPLPINQSATLTLVKGTALVVALLALVLFCWRLVPLVGVPTAWPWLAAGAFVGYLLADLLSGTVHWFCDSFFSPDTPLIGRLMIYPFRDHHDHPDAIIRYRFLEQDCTNYMILVPPLLIAWWSVTPDAATGGIVFLYGLLLGFAVGSFGTNLFHKWAHAKHVPHGVRWFQRRGLILSPEAHQRHHDAYTHGFCVTNGWMNRVLDPLDCFGRSERLIRSVIGPPRRGHGAEPHR